ncbi:interleukin-15-like isoform X4 [Xiphias gladius]|uniref:interleukin-15-like isoform X4 n=1 Tax=Xiphias gladius TaxID=8245 RepID=UPI001A98502F|nr:interleukin-15-like isoform X4 [Xiphias gladius]
MCGRARAAQMTDFMTALPVIFVQLRCPGDQRLKGVQFQLTCNLCRESHKTQKSDAMLYAPSINDIEEKCKSMSLKCYMLELIMVLDEEDVMNKKASCILDFNDNLQPNSVACPPCEAYSLKNITIFLDRLNNLLEKITAQENI